MNDFLFFLAAYLLGSIPFGLLIGKAVKGIDVREHGSKSTGATNVFRTVGKKWGVLVWLLDMAKGALAVRLAYWISGGDIPFILAAGIGITAILGHTFSIWISFKGGKGVATSLGVFLALAFLPTLVTFLIWIVIFAVTHIISISSLVAAGAFPIVIFLLYRSQPEFPVLLPISFALAAFIIYTHRANIRRLRAGEEKKLF